MSTPSTSAAIRFVIYCRKSTESEDRQQLSLPAQEKAMRELAEKRSLTIVGDPIIESKSAKRPGREQFANMMRQVRDGDADGILCWHLDRLARNPKDGGELMHELLHGNLREIATPTDVYTGDGNDTLMMSILFGMATQYSQTLATNIRRGNRAALEVGRWPGRPPLGYRRDTKTKELERERAARESELERCRRRRLRLRDLLVDAVITDEEYTADLARVAEREVELQQQQAAVPTSLIEPLEDARSFVNLAKSAFVGANRDEKRDILRRLVSNPVLDNKKLRCEAKFPFSELLEIR